MHFYLVFLSMSTSAKNIDHEPNLDPKFVKGIEEINCFKLQTNLKAPN